MGNLAKEQLQAPSVLFNIAFAGCSEPQLPTLLPEQTTRLSRNAFDVLCNLGVTIHRGSDMVLLDIHSDHASQYPVISRVMQFMREREYHPRLAELPDHLKVRYADESQQVAYDRPVHHGNPSFRNSVSTHELFKTELKVYNFASDFGLKDLQDYARTRITTHYPVFITDVRAMLAILGERGNLPLLKSDPVMAEFLASALQRFLKELSTNKDVKIVFHVIDPVAAFKLFVENASDRYEVTTILTNMYEKRGRTSDAISLLADHLRRGASEASISHSKPPTEQLDVTGHFKTLPIQHTAAIALANSDRIVIASKDSIGVLVHSRFSKVENAGDIFSVTQNEVLVTQEDEETPNGQLTVMNMQGDVGRVAKDVCLQTFRQCHATALEELPHKRPKISIPLSPQTGPRKVSSPMTRPRSHRQVPFYGRDEDHSSRKDSTCDSNRSGRNHDRGDDRRREEYQDENLRRTVSVSSSRKSARESRR